MDLETIGEDENYIETLIDNIRSEDEAERKLTITQIPSLILRTLQHRDDILKQLLLVIYNLHTDCESYEILNATNRTPVFRNLLRLYTETIQEHSKQQITALTKIIDFVHSSELLVELAHVLHRCFGKSDPQDETLIEDALSTIKEKAAADLSPRALLMIHSIIAMK